MEHHVKAIYDSFKIFFFIVIFKLLAALELNENVLERITKTIKYIITDIYYFHKIKVWMDDIVRPSTSALIIHFSESDLPMLY